MYSTHCLYTSCSLGCRSENEHRFRYAKMNRPDTCCDTKKEKAWKKLQEDISTLLKTPMHE